MAKSKRSRRRISRFRRKVGLKGIGRKVTSLDMGSRVGNVVFGAALSTVGTVAAPRIPVVGAKLEELGAQYGAPVAGLAIGLAVAGYQWQFKKRKQTAKDIALGAALPVVLPMVQGAVVNFLSGLGFVTADLAAVVATPALNGADPQVLQGYMGQSPYGAQVMQAATYF